MNERVSKIINNEKFIPISIGVVSFVVGSGIGYILGKRNRVQIIHAVPKLEFDKEAMEEYLDREEARLGIERHPSNQPMLSTIEGNIDADQLKEAMTSHHEIEEVVEQNIFAASVEINDDWNYEEELKNRNSDQPYVLHKDEFYAEEVDYFQQSLTYYAGDNILVDQEDAPIYNHEIITGPLLFGHGSGDSKVFYVRNDKRKAEYEIIFDPGLYSVEVLGLEIENNERANNIKHSAPKFKMVE